MAVTVRQVLFSVSEDFRVMSIFDNGILNDYNKEITLLDETSFVQPDEYGGIGGVGYAYTKGAVITVQLVPQETLSQHHRCHRKRRHRHLQRDQRAHRKQRRRSQHRHHFRNGFGRYGHA